MGSWEKNKGEKTPFKPQIFDGGQERDTLQPFCAGGGESLALPEGTVSLCPRVQQVSGDPAHPETLWAPVTPFCADEGGCLVDGASGVMNGFAARDKVIWEPSPQESKGVSLGQLARINTKKPVFPKQNPDI